MLSFREIKERLPLNYELLRDPFNWGILLLMMLLAGVAIAVILPSTPKTPE